MIPLGIELQAVKGLAGLDASGSPKDDINIFIAKVNTLADKAKIRISERKRTLFNCLTPGFDHTGQFRTLVLNPQELHENFTRANDHGGTSATPATSS
ncbi:hypothetical protein E4U14_004393 [Claviceps sp. LM454 group G7]|nr:hypothetical protein E4U14_004393 [Claviceps sp. LM454 group G7]